uniref:Reverse transcriptase n=1 Tax=Cannabis sativa TaxID=3483 RepID=A0A803PNP5_CANSA
MEGQLQGIKIARSAPQISHLMFADDTILFARANEGNAKAIMRCLDMYEAWSGQLCSKAKSSILFSPNLDAPRRKVILDLLKVQQCNGTETHLGNPFVFKRRKREDYHRLKENLMKRLEGWKLKLLSFAGRATLIQSVALSLPIYTMSTCKVPLSTCRELDALIRKYWWTGDVSKGRFTATVSWDNICRPKRLGGLGFRRLEDTNQALLDKLAWMVASNSDKPWVQCFKEKYCKSQSFWSIESRGSDSPVWRGILQSRGILRSAATTIPGRGDTIDLWSQPWVPWLNFTEFRELLEGIRGRFPSLKTVADISLNGNEWNHEMLIDMFGPHVGELIGKINRLPIHCNDMLIWKNAQDGMFTTKRAYAESMELVGGQRNKQWATIWDGNLHPRVSMTLWRVFSGAIPVKGKLNFLTDKGCCLCDSEMESIKHLFWDCPFARALWFSGPFPVGSRDSGHQGLSDIVCESGVQLKGEDRVNFFTFVGCLFDTIWYSRNSSIFKSNKVDIMQARLKMLQRMEDLLSAQRSAQRADHGRTIPTARVWEIPSDTQGLLITDASWKEGKAGIAVGCQDRQSGKWLWSAKRIEAASAMEAEASAIFWALQLSRESGFRSIAIASDALLLVQALIMRRLPPCWKTRTMATKIWSLLEEFQKCTLLHFKRSDNIYADNLAKSVRCNDLVHDFKLRESPLL